MSVVVRLARAPFAAPAAVLLAAMLLGAAAALAVAPPALLLTAVSALAGGVLLLRFGRFEHLVLAIPLLAGAVNFARIQTGTESRLVFSLVAALGVVAFWLLQLRINPTLRPRRALPLTWPLLAFMGVNVVAYVWSLALWDPAVVPWPSFRFVQFIALIVNLLLPAVALLVAYRLQEEIWLRRLVAIILAIGTAAAVSRSLGLPLTAMFRNGTSGVFSAWFCALALGQLLFNRSLRRWQQGLLLLGIGGWFFVGIVRGAWWLTGWLPMVAASGVVLLLRSWRLAAISALVGVVVIALNFDPLYQRVIVANVDEGSLARLILWRTALSHAVAHPLFGTGPAGYAVYNTAFNPSGVRSPHNNYLDILVQTGVVGLALFGWLLVAIGRLGWQVRRLTQGAGFRAGLANGILGGWAGAALGMLLGDWVLPFAYNQTISGFDNAVFTWIATGALVVLWQLQQREQGAQP